MLPVQARLCLLMRRAADMVSARSGREPGNIFLPQCDDGRSNAIIAGFSTQENKEVKPVSAMSD